jgi:2-oxoglutarate dehydrogenase E2 component (dihydrolipoamide succinyltransferase)
MSVSVTMPRLGESVTEGTVTRWLKQEGERVEADEPLLEVSTDKVDTEIPSPAAGVLTRIVVREDETAEVGSELAVIDGGDGASAATAAQPEAQSEPQAQPEAQAQQESARPAERTTVEESRAAPPVDEPSTEKPAEAEAPQPAAAEAPAQSPKSPGAAQGTMVKMPALGESVTEGTVTRWLKQVGDTVDADEPLLEVSTDKVDTEIPSPSAGTLLEIKVGQDETVPVGADLAVIGGAGDAPAPAPEQPATEPQGQPGQPAQQEAAAAQSPSNGGGVSPAQVQAARPPRAEQIGAAQPTPSPAETGGGEDGGYVTPLVRKLATEHGVDLSNLTGTGVGGRIRKQDVLDAAERQKAAASAPAPAPAQEAAAEAAAAPAAPAKAEPSPLRGRTEKLTRMRATIARRMVESLQVSAQLTTVIEVDVTRIARLRDQAKAEFARREGVKLSFLPFFALATVEALRIHPNINASIDTEAGTVTYHDTEHLGVAVDTERGLMVPVVRNAGDLNLAGLARRIADVAERTRTNKVTPDELSGGTFTLTNTGSRGALFDTPIINQPQVAILGTGSVVRRAVVVKDQDLGEIIAPRSMVYLALSYDHRLVDGADAARFLATLKERLEAGHFEAELGL